MTQSQIWHNQYIAIQIQIESATLPMQKTIKKHKIIDNLKKAMQCQNKDSDRLFTFLFPNEHLLRLIIPREIKVEELIQILASYIKMYENPKSLIQSESRPEAIQLASIDNNPTVDGYLFYLRQKDMTVIDTYNFKIIYPQQKEVQHFDWKSERGAKKARLIHHYQLIKKIKSNERSVKQYFVRSKQTAEIMSLTRVVKDGKLTFNRFSILLSMRNKAIQHSTQRRNEQPVSGQILTHIYETFESQKYLNVAHQFVPTTLDRIAISSQRLLNYFLDKLGRFAEGILQLNIRISLLRARHIGVTYKAQLVLKQPFSFQILQSESVEQMQIGKTNPQMINNQDKAKQQLNQQCGFQQCLRNIIYQMKVAENIKSSIRDILNSLSSGRIRRHSQLAQYLRAKRESSTYSTQAEEGNINDEIVEFILKQDNNQYQESDSSSDESHIFECGAPCFEYSSIKEKDLKKEEKIKKGDQSYSIQYKSTQKKNKNIVFIPRLKKRGGQKERGGGQRERNRTKSLKIQT